MKIHAHIITWNEAVMLPFTLKHYLEFCDKIFIWDNGSDDATFKIIAKHNTDGKIIIHKFDTGGNFDDMTNIHIKNNCWKHSKGEADFVIVVDCDELVYHPNIKGFLSDHPDCTFFTPQWFEMVGTSIPRGNGKITEMINMGVMNAHSKMLMFRPDAVDSVNWSVGAHTFQPIADSHTVCTDQEFKTLHYKYLSADYVIARYAATSARFSKTNRIAGFGRHHCASPEEIRETHRNMLNKAVKVI